ncbi:MAG TPA: hypothetical protein VGL59_03815 [Polyangia bacterium]|jgi:hypothetical protein
MIEPGGRSFQRSISTIAAVSVLALLAAADCGQAQKSAPVPRDQPSARPPAAAAAPEPAPSPPPATTPTAPDKEEASKPKPITPHTSAHESSGSDLHLGAGGGVTAPAHGGQGLSGIGQGGGGRGEGIGLGTIGTHATGSGHGHSPPTTAAAPPPPPPPSPPAPALPDFDSIKKSFPTAQASYVIPADMVAGESAHVHLDLSFGKSMADLRAELEKHLPGATVTTTTLRTSPVAQARLTGQHFQITAVTPEEQPIGSDTTTWEWEVTPDSGGKRPLHLSVDAVVTMGAETQRWTINTFEQTVLVKVAATTRVKDFVAGNWQWLWTTLAVPLGGLFFVKRRKRGKKSRPRRPGGAAPRQSQI